MELLRRSLETERELFEYPAKIKLFRRTLEIQDNPSEIDGNPKGILESCSEPPTTCAPMKVAIIEEKEFNGLSGNSQIQELDHFFKNMNI
ncbi:hypothetical protein ACLKA7_001631 [Drosophila subpalustris]